MKTYKVRYEQDEAGYWFATVLGVPGCHTQGTSLETVRGRIREALEVSVDDAENADFIESYKLSAKVALPLAKKAVAAKNRAEEASKRAQKLMQDAAEKLIRAKLSHRDAAIVLGVSHQRIAQLLQEKRRA